MSTMNGLSRRAWLSRVGVGTGAAVVLAAGVPGVRTAAAAPAAPAGQRRRALRVAHLTDVHVQPERGADKGLAACLHHVQAQPDKPDLILTGGDHIMDAMAKDKSRT